jgi:hypothetical protein
MVSVDVTGDVPETIAFGREKQPFGRVGTLATVKATVPA